MTEAQAQALLHVLFEGDVSTPASTDAEYLTRRGLLNAAINIWEGEEEAWRELFVPLTATTPVDGATATVASTAQYDVPAAFRWMAGTVRIGSTDYPFKDVRDLQFVTSTDTTQHYYYISGNASATYHLNLHPTPSAVETIAYDYYKNATQLTATNSVFEMSEPLFAVYFALAHLKANAGEELDLSMASSFLDKMKTRNEATPAYKSNKIPTTGSNRWGR